MTSDEPAPISLSSLQDVEPYLLRPGLVDPSRHADVLLQLPGGRELLPPHDRLPRLQERRHLRQGRHPRGNELQVNSQTLLLIIYSIGN